MVVFFLVGAMLFRCSGPTGLSQGFGVLYFFVFSEGILLTGHFLFFRSKPLQPPFLLFSGGISSAPFFGPEGSAGVEQGL